MKEDLIKTLEGYGYETGKTIGKSIVYAKTHESGMVAYQLEMVLNVKPKIIFQIKFGGRVIERKVKTMAYDEAIQIAKGFDIITSL